VANLTVGSMDVMVTADIGDLQTKMDGAAAAVQANSDRMARAAAQVEQLNQVTTKFATSTEAVTSASARSSAMLATMQKGMEGLKGAAAHGTMEPLTEAADKALGAVGKLSDSMALGSASLAVRLGVVGAAATAGYYVWEHWTEIVGAAHTAIERVSGALGGVGPRIAVSGEGLARAAASTDAYTAAVQRAAGAVEDWRLAEAQKQYTDNLSTIDKLTRDLDGYAARVEQVMRRINDLNNFRGMRTALTLNGTTPAEDVDALVAARAARAPAQIADHEAELAALAAARGAAEAQRASVQSIQDRLYRTMSGRDPDAAFGKIVTPDHGRAAVDQDLEDVTRIIQDQARAYDRLAASADGYMSRLDPSKAALDKYIDTMQAFDAALAQGRMSQDEFTRMQGLASDEWAKSLNELAAGSRAAQDEALNLGRGLQSAFDGVISNSKKASDAVLAFGNALAKTLERAFITKPLENALNNQLSGVTSGNIGSSLLNLLGLGGGSNAVPANQLGLSGDALWNALPALPARAAGGPVDSGTTYLVGENGPELFTSDRSGQIIPNGALGGGGTTINIDARGAGPGTEAAIDAVLARRLPGIVAAANSSLITQVNRGGSAALAMGRRS
jgi:hypothetical protein